MSLLVYSKVIRLLSWDAVDVLIKVLKAEQGTHEENGPNDGTCEKYQEVTGNGPGDSWCLSFLMWGVLQIVVGLQQLREVFGVVTASCEQLREVARLRSQLLPVGTAPQKGDIGLVVKDDHAHHAFLVSDGPGEDDSMETVEGNSNDTGGSNGDGAYVRESRFGVNDSVMQGVSANHYELIRVTIEGET